MAQFHADWFVVDCCRNLRPSAKPADQPDWKMVMVPERGPTFPAIQLDAHASQLSGAWQAFHQSFAPSRLRVNPTFQRQA